MLGNVNELKSLLMLIHILCIVLVVSRQFILLLSNLTMLQLLVPSQLSLPFFGSVSKFTFVQPDKEMADLVALVKSHACNFHVIK